jgi:hypothetical protein
MKRRIVSFTFCSLLVFASLAFTTPIVAQRPAQPKLESGSSKRDDKLWQKPLAIHRRAIVIDTHDDVTTPMTNDDYDLSGAPPLPYRTTLERMKQGGMTAEFFSLYVRP